MRERFEYVFPEQQGQPSLSRRLHKKLALPGQYMQPQPLRDLYFDSGRALLDRDGASAEETIDCFKKALQADVDSSRVSNWEIVVYLAAAYEKKGDVQIAFHTYLEAVLLEPQHVIPLLDQAHELLTTKIVRSELAWIEQEWRTVGDTPGLTDEQRAKITQFLGRVYLHADKYSIAIEYFKEALTAKPDDVRVLEGLGQAELDNGETALAVATLKKAYSLTVQGISTDRISDTRVKLVRALTADGQYAEALAFIPDNIVASIADDKKHRFSIAYGFALNKGLCHLALGEPQQALEAANLASEFRPKSCQSHLLAAQAYIVLKDYDNALLATNEALLDDPSNNDILFYEAQARIEGDRELEQGLKLLQSYRDLVNNREASTDKSILERIHSAPFVAREEDASMHYFRAQLYFTFSQDEEFEQEYYAEAEREITRVFELSFADENSNLEASAQQLRGNLIVEGAKKKRLQLSPEQKEQAANYFYEAGVLFYNQATIHVKEAAYNVAAEKVLGQAISLRPEHALSYIYRAAALLYSFLLAQTPADKPEKFDEVLSVWQEGEKLGIPQSFASWAYFIYANCLYQQANMLGTLAKKSKALYWESAYYLERAIVLTPSEEVYFSLLSYCYSFLDRPESALATTQFIQNTPDFLLSKKHLLAYHLEDENALVDIEVGLDNSVFIYTHAWLLYLNRKFQAVTMRLEACIAADDRYVSARTLCGRAYRMLGKDAQAEAHFQHILDVTAPGQLLATPDNMQERANAAYELHHYDEAIHILENMSEENAANPLDRYAILGFCYLALKRTDEARKALLTAINYFPTITLPLHASLQDLAELEPFHLHNYAYTLEVQEIITSYKEALQKAYQQVRAQSLSHSDTEEELLQPLQQVQVGSIPWLASLAAAARIALKEQRVEKAITCYQQLLDYDATRETTMFPEARIGQANAYITLGVQSAFDEQIAVATEHLHRGLHLYIESKQDNPMQVVVQHTTTFVETFQQYRVINETLSLLAQQVAGDAAQRRDLLSAQMQLSREKYFTTRHQDYIEVGHLIHEFVADNSIVLELGLDFISDEEFITEQIVKIAIPAMRERIRQSMGVTIAGVRLRDNLTLPSNGYQILLYNVSDGVYTLPIDYSTTLAMNASISDAYAVMISHLEARLRQNLDVLLGVQEAQLMLDAWKQNSEENRVLLKEALPDDVAVARLTQVLRRLVRTHTSIADLKSILTTFKELQALELNIVVEQMVGVYTHKNAMVSDDISGGYVENTLSTNATPEAFTLFLQHLEKLGISLQQRDRLQSLFRLYTKHGFSGEDCAELAFARLRTTTIEIRCPAYFQKKFDNEDVVDSQALSSLSLTSLEQRLFDELGIIPPKLALISNKAIKNPTVQINNAVHPLPLTVLNSTEEFTEAIHTILVQHAAQLLDCNDVEYHLAQLHSTYPVLVQAALTCFTLGEITRTLRNELWNLEPILDIRFHLEHMLDSTFMLPGANRESTRRQ